MRWGGLLLMVALGCGGAHPPVAAPPHAPSPVVGAPAHKVDPARPEAEQAAWKQAANYTNLGKDTLVAAANSADPETQDALLVTARTTYFSAVRAWTDALAVTTVRTYATRFWLADAWNKLICIEYIQKSRAPARYSGPAPTDVASAITAATAARDAIDGDEYLDLAAAFVIEETDVLRDLEYLAYEETKGASGIAKRTLVELEGPPGPTRVKVVPIPEAVLRSIQARVDYMHRVPEAADADRKAAEFGFEAGQTYYVYGRLEEARTVLGEVHREQCRKSPASYRAWELLLAIASKQHDEAEARRLAAFEQVHGCGTVDPKPESRAPIIESYYRDRRAQPFAAPFVFRAAWELSRLALETSDPSYPTWLENARVAGISWARSGTQDDRATYDAQGPLFAQLDRELAAEHVTATTNLAALFRGRVAEVSAGPAPVSP